MISQKTRRVTLRSLLVWTLMLTGAGTAIGQETPPKIVSIEVVGNKHISTETILAAAKIKVGDPIDKEAIKEIQQRIGDTGYFGWESDGDIDKAIHITSDGSAGEARLRIAVRENPLIKKIELVNTGPLSASKLRPLLTLQPNSVLNITQIQKDALALKDAYNKQGYIAIVASADFSQDQTGLLRFSLLAVRYAEIKLTGQKRVPSRTIHNLLKLKPGDYYNINTLLEARRRLHNTGYFEEVVVTETPVSPDTRALTFSLVEEYRLPSFKATENCPFHHPLPYGIR